MSKKNRQDNNGRTKLEPGLTIPVDYLRTVDGDTVEVEIRRKFKIRLRDINVAERKTEEGQEALTFVTCTLGVADDLIVFIPTNNPDKLMDITSFERIVGDLYVDGELLQTLLREKGYGKDG